MPILHHLSRKGLYAIVDSPGYSVDVGIRYGDIDGPRVYKPVAESCSAGVPTSLLA